MYCSGRLALVAARGDEAHAQRHPCRSNDEGGEHLDHENGNDAGMAEFFLLAQVKLCGPLDVLLFVQL